MNYDISKKVVINGVIDEIKDSRNQLVLVTENKERVVVVVERHFDIREISRFFGKEITLTGKAHFQPGGQLSYLLLEEFAQPVKADRYFSKKPRQISVQQQIAMQLRKGKKANPLADIIGKWPGDETDEEFERMLDDLD